MHPRNPYRVPIEFPSLASSYPALKEHLVSSSSGNATIDFKNDASLRCLTQALLFVDFGLRLSLPEDRLCPPVPNRLNYLLWIQDIIGVHAGILDEGQDLVHGIDVGTGASAIYPLLGCKLDLMWKFTATELDAASIGYAQTNVSSNGLNDRIRVLPVSADGPILFPLDRYPGEEFTFTMCNPPFYSSADEVQRSADGKADEPNAVCTGAAVEMITLGGESAFVCRMVDESARCGTRCRWYTSMLGKLSSVSQVVSHLRELSIENYALTEFVQGQTRRWAVGWTFSDIRLPDTLARISSPSLHTYLPPHNTLKQPLPHASSLSVIKDILLSSIEGATIRPGDDDTVVVSVTGDTWSRAARRRRQRREKETLMQEEVYSVRLLDAEVVEFQWVRGKERGLFESFCSHISRKVLSSS